MPPRGNQGNPKNMEKRDTNKEVTSSKKKKKKEKEEEEWKSNDPCKFHYLPKVLVVDILSRILCVRTVFNCKCVCKEWLSIISDPRFARLHLRRSPIGILMDVLHSYSTVIELDFAQIVEGAAGSDFGVEKTPFTAKNNLPNFQFVLINSCNGLLCLYGPETDGLYVCNPMLGECITIPPNNNGRRRCGFIALGYSIGTNEYKVLQTTSSNNEFYGEREAEIYTLGTGVWTSIGTVPQTILTRSTNKEFSYHLTVICTELNIGHHMTCQNFLYILSILKENNFDCYPRPHSHLGCWKKCVSGIQSIYTWDS
ncbi:hypothetical protein C1H46_039758 [Malus baccata]|uniref:F-box associated beta-propeller type 1 domain-containing protein n=1 Tax=Malus baccata TaxID=106549 RepID=A0A540KKG8_MALBA|nr:hypothetical protein C1H46_039758 [Malus baccata]